MRGEYYMQTWVDAGSPDGFVYTDEHANAYPESLSFLDWACALEVESEAMGRLMEGRSRRLAKPVDV